MEITIEFTNVELLVVDEISHTVTMRMYLGIHWEEPRLICISNNTENDKTPLDLQLLDHLWLPDLDIYHVKQINEFKVLKKLAGKFTRLLCYTRL